ncbi:hypothetical protein KGP36_03420 [Patescibacteria group bacterium]|nr:hypothetical protein [Patescibacteria group bacterium]
MREALLLNGYVRVFDDHKALCSLVEILTQEGHAVLMEETYVAGRKTSTTAHHYMTCTACARAYQEGVDKQ